MIERGERERERERDRETERERELKLEQERKKEAEWIKGSIFSCEKLFTNESVREK